MKKNIWAIAWMLITVHGIAQKEFTRVYALKFPVSADRWGSNEERSVVVAGDMSELCGVDGVTGKVMWQLNTKERFGSKRAERWFYHENAGVIELFFKGDKKGEETKYLIDDRTGATIENWNRENKKRDDKPEIENALVDLVNSSWKGADGVELADKNLRLELRYERPEMNASFGRGKKMPITVKCTGAKSWSTTVTGAFVRSLCDNVVGYGDRFGGDFIDMKVIGDYVFIQYEGLSVLDLYTGKLLWETTFDFSKFEFGLLKAEMIIGRAPLPVCDGGAAYIADLSRDVRAIRKFDLRTGDVLWESERLPKDAIITEMIVVNGALIVRNGGEVLVQKLVSNANTGAQTCISEWKEEGDFSLTAYDVNTGKALWAADDLKALGDKFKGISNLKTDGSLLYVASEKNLFCLDPQSGSAKWKVELSKLKVGKPSKIYFLESDVFVSANEGFARVKKDDGSIVYGTKTDQNLGMFFRADVCYVWTGKKPEERSKFIRFNLATGAIEGVIDDTMYPYFSLDGNEFIKKDGNTLLRYRTN